MFNSPKTRKSYRPYNRSVLPYASCRKLDILAHTKTMSTLPTVLKLATPKRKPPVFATQSVGTECFDPISGWDSTWNDLI